MDPFTHAFVGLGIAALSGQKITPYSPIYCATVFGALAPDLDVIAKLKDNLLFMKHHRGPSHSLSGLLLFSAMVAGIIYLDFGGNPLPYFLWALAGAVSHGVLDYLNSYGAELWWPFSSKRSSGNLLSFTDPVLLLIFMLVFFAHENPQNAAIIAFSLLLLYLLLRFKMRRDARLFLKKKYNLLPQGERLTVLPALKGLTKWDFLVERPHEIIQGTLDPSERKICDNLSMDRETPTPLVLKALQSAPGALLRQLTSYYHVVQWEDKGRYFIKLLDLRFKNKSDFFYKVTLVYNKHQLLEEAYFYHFNEAIPLHPQR
jgi:inner membrane protein